jgi:hypothetical protein
LAPWNHRQALLLLLLLLLLLRLSRWLLGRRRRGGLPRQGHLRRQLSFSRARRCKPMFLLLPLVLLGCAWR